MAYSRRHWLVGVLLQQVADAMDGGIPSVALAVRACCILPVCADRCADHAKGWAQAATTLRAVLTKLAMDARYKTDAVRTRISNMFFPFLAIVRRARPSTQREQRPPDRTAWGGRADRRWWRGCRTSRARVRLPSSVPCWLRSCTSSSTPRSSTDGLAITHQCAQTNTDKRLGGGHRWLVEWLRKARDVFPLLLDTLSLCLAVFQVRHLKRRRGVVVAPLA
jgi:hypothetical protein